MIKEPHYTRRPRTNPGARSEQGGVLAIVALLLLPLLLMVGMSLSFSEGSSVRSDLRVASDRAASAGVGTYCSTRRCYNLSLIAVLESLKDLPIASRSGDAVFDGAVDNAVAELQGQIATEIPYISGPDGNTIWEFDGIRVEIDRGRWWAKDLPSTIPASVLYPKSPRYEGVAGGSLPDSRFESFDDEVSPGVSWQEWQDGTRSNHGTPNFFAANAVRVSLTRRDMRNFLARAISAPYDIQVETIATRIGESTDKNVSGCAAPFAIPVCALLNNDGEFDPEYSCQVDRFFTEVRRYCRLPAAANQNPIYASEYSTTGWHDYEECSVVPGSFWAPTGRDIYCDPDKPWYSQQRCDCGASAGEGWTKARIPCGQEFGHASMECSFNTWAHFDQVADHYGVVGLSVVEGNTVIGSPVTEANLAARTSEANIQNIFVGGVLSGDWACRETLQDGREQQVFGTLKFSVGNKFQMLPAGLTGQPGAGSSATAPMQDQLIQRYLWNMITSQSDHHLAVPGYRDIYHPRHFDPTNTSIDAGGFRDLGYWWFTGRINDALGFPYGEGTRLLTRLEAEGAIIPTGTSVAPHTCFNNAQQQYGTMNSQVAWYDNRCQRLWAAWMVPNPPGNAAEGTLWGGNLWDISHMAGLSGNKYSHPTLSAEEMTYNFFGMRQGVEPPTIWSLFAKEFTVENPDLWSCLTSPPPMPCAAPHHLMSDPATNELNGWYTADNGIEVGQEALDGSGNTPGPTLNYYAADNTRLWNTLVPVIADTSSTAAACSGINGETGFDPHINPTHDWRIIGFIRTYLYDVDIGTRPPPPPGVRWEAATTSYTEGGVTYRRPGVSAGNPPVCSQENTVPWGFQPGYSPPDPSSGYQVETFDPATNRSANVVRGRTACNPGLVSGDFHGMAMEPLSAPMIVHSE